MKKLILLISIITSSCNTTTSLEDIQNLQKDYKIVYRVNVYDYIVYDSVYYHVNLNDDGTIKSKIRIN